MDTLVKKMQIGEPKMEPFEEYLMDIDDEYFTDLSDYYSDYYEYEDRVSEEEDEDEYEDEEDDEMVEEKAEEAEEIDIYAALISRFHEHRAERISAKTEAHKSLLRGLIGIEKKEDLSRETLITPEDESISSAKSSTESSIHPCLKDIDISDSQLKLHNLYTKYPIPDDPGLVPAFWTIQEHQTIYPEDGVMKFEDLTKLSGLQPIQSLKDMLLSDSINLQYYGVNSAIIRPLCEALMNNPSVETINLTGNWLSEDACYHLNDLLTKNNIITTLFLSGCLIGPNGAAKIYDGIMRNVTLTTLDLSDCNIRNEGLSHVTTAICNNESIQNLSLSGNHLDETCSDTLQRLLSCSDTLKHLDLSWNSLYTVETWKKLCKGLENNTTLVDLDLSWNALGKECVPFLRRLLLHSIALQKLDLSGNRFYDEDAVPIARALSKNNVLKELHFGDNPVKGEGAFELVKAVTPNKAPDSQLQILDLTNIWANKNILPELDSIKNDRPWLEIKLGGILSNYTVEGPDVKTILLKRANYEAMKPKNKKRRKNFGHFVLSLSDDLISRGKFTGLVKNFRLKLSQSLINEIIIAFAGPRHTVDQNLLKSIYMKQYPDTKLPPEKPVKKKKKAKAKGKKKTK
nr:uncharacterized protein LOC117602658 [Osmia lignaria]